MVDVDEMLEKIIFDEDQLVQLKDLLTQLSANQVDLKIVKQAILDQRSAIMRGVLEFLPFCLNFEKDGSHAQDAPQKVQSLRKKVKEREELLEEIGRRLTRMTF